MNSTQAEEFLSRQQPKVQGWLFSGAVYTMLLLMRMQMEVQVDGAVGEIGVHHGKLTSFLAFFARKDDIVNRQFFAADLFEGMQKLNIDSFWSGELGQV